MSELMSFISQGAVASAFAAGLLGIILNTFQSLIKSKNKKEIEEQISKLEEDDQKEIEEVLNQLAKTQGEISDLKERLPDLESNSTLTEDNKEELYSKVIDELPKNILDKIENLAVRRYRDRFENRPHIAIHRSKENAVNRLLSEIKSIKKIGYTSFYSGILLSFIGIMFFIPILLSEVVANGTSEIDKILNTVPKFSFILFIEVISIYLIRLYIKKMAEVRYYQNEITNIENRFIGLYSAIRHGSDQSLDYALKAYSDSERNFVLEKGQSTTEIRKEEVATASEASRYQTVADVLSKILPNQRGN